MRVLVPFDATDPKTRLSGVLDAEERRGFAVAMLRDVLAAVRDAGGTPSVLSTAAADVDAAVAVDDRSLSAAVNARLGDGPVAVVAADLGLVTAGAVSRLFDADGEVVLAPGRGGGTNAIVARHPSFRVDYHGISVRDHRRAARSAGADLAEVDSFRLATDVDERADLVEVLLHGEGEAADWLSERFEVVARDGRVGVERA